MLDMGIFLEFPQNYPYEINLLRFVIHKQWKFNVLAKRIFYKLINYLWIKLFKV